MNANSLYTFPLTPPDPTLIPANILKLTCDIPLWGRRESHDMLDMPLSKYDEIAGKFDGEEAKQKLITAWLDGHPCPTWKHVGDLLRYGVRGDVGEKAADEVEETYLKSEFCCICSSTHVHVHVCMIVLWT